MKGIVKALIAGGIIIGIGVILLIVALSLNGWKFSKDVNFETATYECQSVNSNLDIEVNAGKVKTEFYDGDKIIIEYPKSKDFKTVISEENGTLIFKSPKEVWYKNWFFSFRTYSIPDSVIKLPASGINKVKVEVNAGSVSLGDGSYGSVEIDIDAGAFNGGNITCSTFNLNVDAGAVTLKYVSCQAFTCGVSAGSVTVNGITSHDSVIKVQAGSVTASFAGAETDYTVTTRVKAGSCNLYDRTSGNPDSDKIDVDVSAGKVTASFTG